MKSDKSARAFWNLAKVEELITSRDGVVRAARVRVVNQDNGKSTVLRRPVQHLIPLEIRSDGEQTEAKVDSTLLVETQREDSSLEETKSQNQERMWSLDEVRLIIQILRDIFLYFNLNRVLHKRLTLGSVMND